MATLVDIFGKTFDRVLVVFGKIRSLDVAETLLNSLLQFLRRVGGIRIEDSVVVT